VKDTRSAILENMPVNKLIWKLSVPSIIGIISYNLYNIIDTIYIARGVDVYAAGGLAITFPLFMFLSAISSTMGAGAASIISRAIGQKDIEKASKTAGNTFITFWFIALLITVFGLIHLDGILYAMGVTPKLLPYAREYMRIILIGAVTSTGFSSLIRAEGSSKYAMYQWILPVLANVILDPVFIFTFHQGIRGAAMATVISQVLSVGMFVHYYFLSGKTQLNLQINHFIPDVKMIVDICLMGMPSFVQIASQSVTIIIINNVLKQYGGDLYISTYGIVNKIVVFLLIPIQGIVQGIQPIIGYNYGAGIKIRVRETIKYACKIAGGYGLLVSAGIILLPKLLIYPFTDNKALIVMGSGIIKIICLGMAFTGIQMIQTAYFQSIGKTRIAFLLSLCNYILCFIPILLLFSSLGGINWIWFAFPVSNILAFCISSICVGYQNRKSDNSMML
jgi:putative MATE family efflux protein